MRYSTLKMIPPQLLAEKVAETKPGGQWAYIRYGTAEQEKALCDAVPYAIIKIPSVKMENGRKVPTTREAVCFYKTNLWVALQGLLLGEHPSKYIRVLKLDAGFQATVHPPTSKWLEQLKEELK